MALKKSLEMTPSLEYMLGLTEWVVHPDMVVARDHQSNKKATWFEIILFTATKPEHYTLYGKYIPDMSNVIGNMFIYCDEVEQSIVGDVKARLLAMIPIDSENQGSSSLCNYSKQLM